MFVQGKTIAAGLILLLISCSAPEIDSFGSNLLSGELRRQGVRVSLLEQTADPDRLLSVQEIRQRGAEEWKTHRRAYPTFGYTNAAHWFRLRISNPDAETLQAVLRVAFEHIDHIEIHAYQGSERYLEKKSGREYDFSVREFPHRRFAFSLGLLPGETTLYIMARSRHTLNVPIRLLTPTGYREQWVGEQIRMVLYFGTIVILFFLNCLFYYVFRDEHLLYYLVYVFANVLTQIAVQGFGLKYFWPESPEWNAVSLTVMTVFFGNSILLFCKRFLNTALHLPWTNRLINLLIASTVFILLSLWFLPLSRTEALVNLCLIAGAVLCTAAGVQMFRQGNHAARFYLIGWSLFFSLAMVYLAQNAGLIPNGFFFGIDMYEFLLLGGICEMIFFPIAISDRIRTIVREHAQRDEPVSPLSNARPSRLTRLDLSAVRKRLYDLMNDHQVYRKNITLGKLARFAGISEKDLSEFLNEEERKSFYQFVNEFRIGEACRLLLARPGAKILEIAHDVGFQSLSTFNSAFQKQQGMSPRAFRKTEGVTG